MILYFLCLLFCHLIFSSPVQRPNFTLKDAEQFESPWFALLIINGKYCGGSLVQDQYVITAAHCFKDESIKYEDLSNTTVLESLVKVRFGEWKTNTDPDCEYGVDGEFCESYKEILPKNLVIHENYNSGTGVDKRKDDIAIIKLGWPPRSSEAISSIEIPPQSNCSYENVGDIWTVTGFGHMPGTKKYSVVKKKIDMKMITHEECETKLGSNQEFYNQRTHICGTGTERETTCQGDSGSGLTYTKDDESVLLGIVSFGVLDCGTLGVPTGYVKVACYSDWIKSTIAKM